MSAYRSTGGLDDAIADDGDRGFVGVNQRDPLNQLPAGVVRESLNGRMDGHWKPRKNVVALTGALTVGGLPLNLPFYLMDAVKTISAATYEATNKVRITVTGHGFAAGSQGQARVSGLTTTAANGDFLLSYVDANTLEYTVAGLTAVTTSTGTLATIPINDSAAANVRASCLFSDPATESKEFVIVALDTVAKVIDLADTSATPVSLSYPTGQALGSDTDMMQLFDKVILFRDGQQAFEWYPNGRPILSASRTTTEVTMSVKSHGLVAGDTIVVSGLTGTAPPNGTFTVLSVSSKDVFIFNYASAGGAITATAGILKGGFTLSEGGDYTQPQTFNLKGNKYGATDGVVRFTVTGNVTISAGDTITILETTVDILSPLVGNQYQVVQADTTDIYFLAPVPNVGYGTGSSSDNIDFGGNFSVGGGFMHQPGAPWGTYFQRRLWVPYYYDQSGAYNNVTFTNRKIRDEIAVSDILDTNTYDQIENQFRISGGTADFVVGMHGFYEDKLIVFNRNSLHLISGTQGTLLDTVVTELTSEIGCVARKSIVSRGNLIMFLSDDGVYAVEFLNDYNLRGSEEPLSKNIQPYIDRINRSLADKSIGILYDNRYFLAVPLDSVPNANDARGNNAILVFNFLNKGWESLDTYGDSRFLIEDLVIGSANVRNNLFAVTSNGGLHQLEANDSSNDRLGVDNLSSEVSTPTINAKLTTRGYDLGTMDRKRFTDAQIVMQNLAGQTGEYNIAFSSEDPDNAAEIGTTTQFLGGQILAPSDNNESETAGIRCRLGGIRGYNGTLILTRTIGSPKINSIKVAGSVTNRQIISQK